MKSSHCVGEASVMCEGIEKNTIRRGRSIMGLIIVSWNTKEVNTAGILRVADAFGAEEVYFRRRPKSMAAAVGTHNYISYRMFDESEWDSFLAIWHAAGYVVVAVEQHPSSVLLPMVDLPRDMVCVVGNESGGIPPRILVTVDQIVEIPQWGLVASLNVATSAALVAYHWAVTHADMIPRSVNAIRKYAGIQHPFTRVDTLHASMRGNWG